MYILKKKKKNGMDILLKPLIEDFIFLEQNGIELSLSTGTVKVNFI